MIVVADTTPLLVLARIGRRDLLRDLYAEVLVPRAVYDELVERRTTAPGVDALREASWIRVVDVGPSEAVALSPLARLDAGAHAIGPSISWIPPSAASAGMTMRRGAKAYTRPRRTRSARAFPGFRPPPE